MMSSRKPCERPRPGVIGKSCRAANSIDSLLPTIGIQIGGRGRCTGRGHSGTSLYDQNTPSYEKIFLVPALVMMSKASSKRARDRAHGTLLAWVCPRKPPAKPQDMRPL